MAEKIKTVKKEKSYKKKAKKVEKKYTAIPHCACEAAKILECLKERLIRTRVIDDPKKAGNYVEKLVGEKGYKKALNIHVSVEDEKRVAELFYIEKNPTKLRIKTVEVKEKDDLGNPTVIEVNTYYLVDEKDLADLKALAEEKCKCHKETKDTPPSAIPVEK